MTVRALIAEDEPLGRRALREYARDVEWLEIVADAADGRTAARLIDDLEPDLVFLDVRMPEMSGLEVLRSVRHAPAVVFTTAYDGYAVAAFELEALDYLLKPFGRDRFLRAMERVRRRLAEQNRVDGDSELPSVVERAGRALATSRSAERIFVPHAGRILPVRVADVSRLTAEDDYTRVHSAGKSFLVALTLAELERRLDRSRFVRVHRSAIVALDYVASIERRNRRLVLHMHDGGEVLASRAGSQALRHLMT